MAGTFVARLAIVSQLQGKTGGKPKDVKVIPPRPRDPDSLLLRIPISPPCSRSGGLQHVSTRPLTGDISFWLLPGNSNASIHQRPSEPHGSEIHRGDEGSLSLIRWARAITWSKHLMCPSTHSQGRRVIENAKVPFVRGLCLLDTEVVTLDKVGFMSMRSLSQGVILFAA